MSQIPNRSDESGQINLWPNLASLLTNPAGFFQKFLGEITRITNAKSAAIIARDPTRKSSDSSWRVATCFPPAAGLSRDLDSDSLQSLITPATANSPEIAPIELTSLDSSAVCCKLPKESTGGEAFLALFFPIGDDWAAQNAGRLLPLLVTVPGWLEQQRQLDRAQSDLGNFGSVLDLTVLLYSEERFHAAAMLICNEVASRYGCFRASLGWMEGNNIQIRAISHTDKIEKRMESVQQLAAAMEEATDQGSEILYPNPSDAHRRAVDRDHKIYVTEHKLSQAITLPLLRTVSSSTNKADPDEAEIAPIAGALTLEKDEGEFTDQEIRSLRLLCDQITPRLWQLRQSEGWFGARLLRGTRRFASRIVGVDHTWLKLLAIVLAVGLAYLIFGKDEFQVKAPFSVETNSMVYLSAPYAGYLDETPFREGDIVEEGDTIFALDTSELLLEKQQAIAETTRYRTESIRAEAAGEISEMRIAKALLKQAEARSAAVQYQLDNAIIVAPFDGVIIEGELTERINSPVEKGEVLVKLAKLTGLYPELKVNESDVRFLEDGASGKIAFAARPDLSFSLTLDRIEPAARSDESGNHFTVRCLFEDDPLEWWRPGMSGIAKIDCGEKSLLWIYTRKTVDRIRLFFW